MIKIKSVKSILLGGAMITISGVGAYMMKSAALEREQKLELLKAQIQEEQDKITVLEADWSYLTRPARIQQLSREILSFAPAEPSQILTLDALGEPPQESETESKLFQIRTIKGWNEHLAQHHPKADASPESRSQVCCAQ